MKRFIKKILFMLPRFLRNGLYIVSNWILHRKMLKKRYKGGSIDDDKTYYIIRPRTDGVEGIMALLLFILKQTWYADKNGYIPVVDMKNYMTQYYQNDEDNAFLYFFKPLNGITVEEAYKHKKVILSSVNVFYTSPKKTDLSFKKEDLLFMRNLFDKYYAFSDEVMALFNEEMKKLSLDRKCLGIYARGTDYVNLKPAGHPRQPLVEQLIEKADELFADNSYQSAFFVSEDKNMYDAMKEKYGDKLKIASFDSFISNYQKDAFISKKYIEQLGKDKKTIGLNYIVKLLILADSDYIICGKTCGSWAALLFAKDMDNTYVFNLGNY